MSLLVVARPSIEATTVDCNCTWCWIEALSRSRRLCATGLTRNWSDATYSWIDAAKFLTGASSVGSIAIPIILRHADLIGAGAMCIEFVSFFIFVCTVLCFHRATLEDDW